MNQTVKTQEFLTHFPGYWLQTLDDKNAKEAVPLRKEPLKYLINDGPPSKLSFEFLHKLNSQEAGIFFSPNKFTKRRKADQCEGVNAWIVEMDDVSKEEQWERINKAALKPSLVVESGKSLHVYYLAKDGKSENYKDIINGLIQTYNGDMACSDISRLLRIPGFYHNKKQPFMVTVKLFNPEIKYTEDEMIKAFPHKETIKPKKIVSKGDDFWTTVNSLPNKWMLERLSGTSMVRGEIISFRERPSGGEYIDVNGSPADCWLDEQGLIGSGKGGAPTFVNFLRYYGWSLNDIAKWIKQNCTHMLPKSTCDSSGKPDGLAPANIISESKEIKASDLAEDVVALANQEFSFTWGTQNLDNEFAPLVRRRYVVLVGETGTGKTAFAFDMAVKNAKRGNKVLFLSLEMSNAGLITRYARSRAGISKRDWKNKDFLEDDLRKYTEALPETLLVSKIKRNGQGIDMDFIKNIVNAGKYDMVIVDNFGFIEGHGNTANDQMKNISREMVALRDETDATIIAIHHFRKRGGDAVQQIRAMDSILGSAKLSHDVDFAVQVFRDMNLDNDCEPKPKAELVIVLMKDRDFGESRVVSVYFDKGEFHDSYPPKA